MLKEFITSLEKGKTLGNSEQVLHCLQKFRPPRSTAASESLRAFYWAKGGAKDNDKEILGKAPGNSLACGPNL